MVGTTVTINVLPFSQQLILMLIQTVIPIIGSVIMIVFLYRYMPKLMDKIMGRLGRNTSYDSYNCKCSRCNAESSRVNLRQWKRKVGKFRKRDMK